MAIAKRLLGWYDRHRRDLPWRLKRSDPYKTWISEIMLQQTQVETVIPYFGRFLKRFPDVVTLAQAREEAVVTLWSGLGYYSRARNLHKAARVIAGERGGRFPERFEEWLALPGIGRYTAGAIASIANGERVPVVDGNVIRVLSRLHAVAGDLRQGAGNKKIWGIATQVLPRDRVGDFNQALMELGALVCVPREPKCPVCPLRCDCEGLKKGNPSRFPETRKQKSRKEFLTALMIEKKGSFLLARRNDKNHLKLMWEFPQGREGETGILLSQIGIRAEASGDCPPVRHAIMNRAIRLVPKRYLFQRGSPRPNEKYVAYRWIRPEDLGRFPTSSLNRKILDSRRGVRNKSRG